MDRLFQTANLIYLGSESESARKINKAGAEQQYAGGFRNHVGRYCRHLVVCEHVGSFNPDSI
jgi:hypothetical protein